MTYQDLMRFIKLWIRVQPAMFRLQPASRRANSYCEWFRAHNGVRSEFTPLHEKDNVHKATIETQVYGAVDNGTYGNDVARDKRHKYHTSRYACVNLHSYFYRGTVEIRLGAGTASGKKVMMWATLCASIMDAAKAKRKIQSLPLDPWRALMELAPTDAHRTWCEARRRELPAFEYTDTDTGKTRTVK